MSIIAEHACPDCGAPAGELCRPHAARYTHRARLALAFIPSPTCYYCRYPAPDDPFSRGWVEGREGELKCPTCRRGRPPIVLGLAPTPAETDFWAAASGARLRAAIGLLRAAVHPRDDRGELVDGPFGGPDWRPWDFLNAWPSALANPRDLGLRTYRGSRAERLTHAAIAERHVLVLGRHAAWIVLRIPERTPYGEIRVAQTLTGAPVVAMIVPHPSGRNLFWNKPDAMPRMVRWLRAFHEDACNAGR